MIENELMKFLDEGTIRIQYRLDVKTPSQLADVLAETVTSLFVQCFGKDQMDDSPIPEAELLRAFARLDNARFGTKATIQEHLESLADFINPEKD